MNDTPIKVALVSENHRQRRRLAKHLTARKDVQLVAEIDAFQAISRPKLADTADLVVLQLPQEDCHRDTRMLDLLCELSDGMRLILLGDCCDEEHVAALLRAGAHGYVLNERAEQELMPAIDSLHHGRRFISRPIMDALAFKCVDRQDDGTASTGSDSA